MLRFNKLAGTVLGAALLIGSTSTSLAGDTYIDSSGFAVSGYDVVSYFDANETEFDRGLNYIEPGNDQFTASYNGAKYAFSSEENRARFVANPAAFAPKFDGHCVHGVTTNVKLPANPMSWEIVDGKLYLLRREDMKSTWSENMIANIAQANDNWSDIESDPASRQSIPHFDPAAAPIKG
ncbi:MAG: YHS domain-containing (seleno)protein [Hyphomicrobiales bacterium]